MTVYRTTSKRKRIAFTYSFHFKIHMWRLWIIALQVRFSWNHQVKSNYPIETFIQKKHHTNEKMCDAKIISSDVVLYSRIYCLTLLNASFLHAHKYHKSSIRSRPSIILDPKFPRLVLDFFQSYHIKLKFFLQNI